jgi:hypothetical protein
MRRMRFGATEGNSYEGSTVDHIEEARGFVCGTGENGSTMWRILQICDQEAAIARGCVRVFGLFIRTEVSARGDPSSVVAGCAHGARENK